MAMNQRLIIPLLVGLLCGCRATRQAEAPAGAHLRVLTYNVNWSAPGPELAAEIISRLKLSLQTGSNRRAQWCVDRIIGAIERGFYVERDL